MPFTARIAMEDVEYRGVTFPEGTVVLVCAFTGNRDGEPEGFDITAERAGKPLTFGAGVHYCLGANLARAELAEALPSWRRGCRAWTSKGTPCTGRSTASTGSTPCRSAGAPADDAGPVARNPAYAGTFR